MLRRKGLRKFELMALSGAAPCSGHPGGDGEYCALGVLEGVKL